MHRLRGFEENWYEASKTDGRCLEPVYRRSKSLSVRRVISRNPFCAVLSRSSLPKKGRRNEKPTKTMQLFNRARFLPFPLSFSSFIPLLFLYFQCSPGDRYPVSLGIVSEPVVKGLRYRLARKFNKPVEARWTTCLNRVDWSESLSLCLSLSLSLSLPVHRSNVATTGNFTRGCPRLFRGAISCSCDASQVRMFMQFFDVIILVCHPSRLFLASNHSQDSDRAKSFKKRFRLGWLISNQ